MQYRKLGNTGLLVSEVALGSWLTYGNSVEQDSANDIVDCAFDHGINFFDTADVYARGEGELAVGKALEGIARKDYVLATKCFFPMSDLPNDRGLSRKHINESIHESLKRLRTDYVDLYQCHRYDEETPLEETVRAMHDLVSQGKVIYWGVSMWSAAQIEEAHRICDEGGYYKPVSNQPLYNLFEREIEAEVLPTCKRLGMSQIVFSPLAQGVLTGKYGLDAYKEGAELPEGSRAADGRQNAFISRYLTEDKLVKVEKLRAICEQLGCTMAEFALAWCLRREELASVIVGATTVEQMEQNVRATELELSESVLQEVEALFTD